MCLLTFEMVCVDLCIPNSVSPLLSVNCGNGGAGEGHVLHLPGAHILLFVSKIVSSPATVSLSAFGFLILNPNFTGLLKQL